MRILLVLAVLSALLAAPVAAAPSHRPPPMPRPQMPTLPVMPGGQIGVFVDGSAVKFDVPPQMLSGWVFVPLRGVFEKMGAKVAFDKSSGLVSADKGRTHVELRVGNKLAKVNDDTVFMVQPALAVQGRTLVPLRFLSEALGAEVDWNGGRRMVLISSKKGGKE